MSVVAGPVNTYDLLFNSPSVGFRSTAVEVSVIIPALCEGENLRKLLPMIASALVGRRYEIIVVDDNSPDATSAV